MLNLTLLSLTIASSFQQSPFTLLSSSSKPNFNILKNIKANQIFSSFLMTQSFNSVSFIEGSTFNRFITSLPILSFKSKVFETSISNQSFYGDTIPGSKNIFYHSEYTEITNCKFMSITDSNNDNGQLFSDGGLCICSSVSVLIDSCYFFAILSYRSGSAILVDNEIEYIESVICNCMFKSITQSPLLIDIYYYTGGAISYGNQKIMNYENIVSPVYYSETQNCCFDNIHLIGSLYYGFQLGIVSYISEYINSSNLNFTDNEIYGYMDQHGMISAYFLYPTHNAFSFINIFNCEYAQYGSFTMLLVSLYYQEFSLSFANFINNTETFGSFVPEFVIHESASNGTLLMFEYIQCNNENSFLGVILIDSNEKMPVDVYVDGSLFGCSFDTFIISVEDHIRLLMPSLESNIFNYSDFDAEITNDIISNFGYIQTSAFSASNTFSASIIETTEVFFDLYQEMPKSIIIVASILGCIALIFFFVILCYRGRFGKIDINQFNQLDFNIENDGLSLHELDSKNKESNIGRTNDCEKESDLSEQMNEAE